MMGAVTEAVQLSVASIRDQRGASLPFDFIVPPAELAPLADEVQPVTPVRVYGQVTNTGDSMLVQGEARGEFALTCARCLQPLHTELAAEFQERFRREGARVPARGEAEGEGDPPAGLPEDDARLYRGNWLHLDEAVREALLLQLPMKPVCGPDCRGLCPQCGTNLNEATCDCQPETIDPRPAVLQECGRRPPAP